MSRRPIHFICDANASVGFGHLSRCLKVASSLRRSRAIRFGGRFSAEAKARIAQLEFTVEQPSAGHSGGLAVVDIMFDKEDMDYFDLVRLRQIRKRFERVVVLSSAMTVPDDLPVDVVIGHVLETARRMRRPFRTFAGLDYSPVSAEFRAARGRRAAVPEEVKRVFVGFGASRDIRGVTSVLDALKLRNFAGEVDLLLSPFHQRFAAPLGRRKSSYRMRIHSNVRSVAPLLRRADIAFGTYGNITFESLCLGTPFLTVAVKDFQLAYAKELAMRGLLVCIGKDEALSATIIADALKSLTRKKRQALSQRARSAVDGRGIDRIRRVIEKEALIAERLLR
jgi:spore coat polysaccharide biosynthesis predicted glycosyltransferase SpsG